MKISKVIFKNFKPYFGKIEIDLSTQGERNLILIGGRNGQGKTSFLVGVVWCLYGSNISQVDEIFKKEVKGNYSKFLNKAINWTAKNDGETHFSVEILFSEVELSEVFSKNEQRLSSISVKRSYDVANPVDGEKFSILMDGEEIGLLSDEVDKSNFVNDYLIPIDIAKFVFFDAEKIAEIASLSAKDQAVIMNEALGKILGLNIYENLVEDLKIYERKLKAEAAPHEINIQINSFENAKKQNEIRIESIEKELDEKEDNIEELKREITECTNELIRRGDTSIKVDIETLRKKEEELQEKLEEVGRKFHEVSDFIPLTIISHKVEEVIEQIEHEEEKLLNEIKKVGLTEKTREFAEKLFNKPPLLPLEEDLNFEQKSFYYNKAKKMFAEIYGNDDNEIKLDFEHNLDRSDIQHIREVFAFIQRYSKDTFEGVFNEFIRIQNDYQEATKELRIAESASQDEFVQEIQDRKNEAERELSRLEREIGMRTDEKIKLELENKTHQTKIDNLLTKVQTSKNVEKQIEVLRRYIKALNEFIKIQKEQKTQILQSTLLNEINRLLNKPGIVEKVEITILQNNLGLEVKLVNDEGHYTVPSTDLSKGEQQLYISALLKSILSESIHDLPVLIDTPLGRLDQEHRDNILTHYYPTLSEQVVIFSTNTEVRTSDMHKIQPYVAKSYRLENIEKKTIVKPGYFDYQ